MKRSTLPQTFQANLIRMREARGWDQTELARRMKISVAYVNMLEHGKRSATFNMLVAAAHAFGVPASEMVE